MQIKDVFSHWEDIRAGLIGILDNLDEEELSFTPWKRDSRWERLPCITPMRRKAGFDMQ
jgi:hypothetical protein